ncbi:septum site-determining protein Ssd [Corynebacterium uberis]|uniref:septum site-determining protein Ssd n=1 Tax=Corynebacterium TaxID=1716 RepID=UPI001D0A0EB4|nr:MULTISPECIES: septum site-determining protein Ssd [Corynebacterium]MCZ9309954.1 pilus assembly protein [Corynebacterium sp. c6VSa_13]UDL73127.1 pilus assembly protein [Corynebacterium uberis]UDL75996.1 pilus assembly protein [Corynebacterium uberis]UDL78208.1 pilus assembly protein [Corynebacterium uberis]UDL80491.1 pilus assembly protein [Corynebacterium uberis]
MRSSTLSAQAARLDSRPSHPVLVVCADPAIHPEASHIAAACGHGTVSTLEPATIARLWERATAVLVDAPGTQAWLAAGTAPRPGVFFLAAEPGPVADSQVVAARAEAGFVLPAQAAEVLRAIAAAQQATRQATPTQREGLSQGTARGSARLGQPSHQPVIGVCGVVGGAGASTTAAALAVAAGSGAVLVDADAHSGGVDLFLGLEDSPGARWPDVHLAAGSTPCADLLAALPTTRAGVCVLSAARSTVDTGYRLRAAELRGAIATLRGGHGPVIVDINARGELAEAACEECDHLIVIVPPEIRAGAAAARTLARMRTGQARLHLVLRARGWSGLGVHDVERLTDVAVTGQIRTHPKVAKLVETTGLAGRLPAGLGKDLRPLLAACCGQGQP